MALKALQSDTVACSGGNPADSRPKVHIMDMHRDEYWRHDHKKDGEHITVTTGHADDG